MNWNFLGLPGELASKEKARAWVLPLPYEATTSYGKGTRKGPAAIMDASTQVELFDEEFGCEPASDYGVHTMEPLDADRESPEESIEAIADRVAGILSEEPGPEVLAILGGEHSISAGTARALERVAGADDLVAVQIDAHADLRDSYEGTPFSHACAGRRILDVCPVFQVGIRNISAEGDEFRQGCDRVHTVFSGDAGAADGGFLEDLAGFVHGKRVFLTIDLDGLDPSVIPAVGTPEPDGISWERTLDVAKTVSREAERVPVFDVVELAPIAGMHASDFIAAKLVYKVLSYVLCRGRA
jgi:agmatinase